MKKITLAFSIFFIVGSIIFAQSALEIAQKVHDLDQGKTSKAIISLTLTDKNGKIRTREIASYTMKEGTTDKSVIVFRSPKDVAGVSYLSFDYPDKADGSVSESDSWLYLPAMKKVRRVSGSSKDDDFQGTDFTYDDLGNRSLGKDTFAILGEENINSNDCWILEYKAKDPKAKISRRVLWIGKSNYMTYKGEYYDRQNNLFKTLTTEDTKQISGYWTTSKMTMTNILTNHQTTYEVKEINYDTKIDANFFTVSALEREIIK